MILNSPSVAVRRVAVVGSYPPRRCGIGTFTADLCAALSQTSPSLECIVLPVNDRESGYAYLGRVRFEFNQHELSDYHSAADFLNINNIDTVCLQHEYGLFGGPTGSHILALLRDLRMPVVTTCHTILAQPSSQQRRVLREIAGLSARLVAMTDTGGRFLQEVYGVPQEKIDVIPHGIPDVPFVDPNFYKDQFGVADKQVLLTFGLLSPGKGIEYAIQALPRIQRHHPSVVYIVLGATHPHVRQRDGESYRLSLERTAQKAGVAHSVIFHNRYVDLQELTEFIGASDLYVTPYLNEEQITSGTLAYAAGAGKAVVSTPYWHARDLLADGRGVLVPFRDSQAIANAVIDLLDNEPQRHAMRKRAYLHTREMIWSSVAASYLDSFARARDERPQPSRRAFQLKTLGDRRPGLPAIHLAHLRHMTDSTGILQHAVYDVPNYAEGYCTDDNARALLLMILLEQLGDESADSCRDLARRYLAFLKHAWNPSNGRFRNFMSYDRRWIEEAGSEDCHGRALWALGSVIGRSQDERLGGAANHLLAAAIPPVLDFASPRAWAFALIGLHEYLRRFSGDRAAREARDALAQKLMDLYRGGCADDWPWFEECMTYANARLPHALLLCGQSMPDPQMTEVGLRCLEHLMQVQTAQAGHFRPIGCHGFYRHGGEPARFDQQPIEAHATLSACLEAFAVTGQPLWMERAKTSFEWFLGRNDLGLSLYDPTTGGCRDALHADRVNQNEGAESTLAYLLARAELELAEHMYQARDSETITTTVTVSPGEIPSSGVSQGT